MKLKNEQLRQRILISATELIIKDGIEGTSTVKVARKIKMSQSNIYSYFKNRHELLIAVFKYQQQKLIANLAPLLNSQLDPISQIESLINGVIQFGTQNFDTIRVIIIFRNQPSLRTTLPTINEDPFFIKLFELIKNYQDQGIVKSINAEFLVEGAFSIINNYLLANTTGELSFNKLSTDEVVSLVKDLILR